MNPFDPGYYISAELREMGFKRIGENVRIARNCTIIGLENIVIGDHVRIDGYTTIVANDPGSLHLGSYIHIGAYCLLIAGEGICMADFSGLSHGVRIYTRTDDYTGKYLTNPTVPSEYTGITKGAVSLEKHVIIGTDSVLLPRVTIGEGTAVGAMSMVTKSLEPWGVYFGVPVKKIKTRLKNILELEKLFRGEVNG